MNLRTPAPPARSNLARKAGLALLLAAALSAGGCGRRGALEPPPGTAAAASATPDSADATQLHGRKKPPAIAPPKADFVLDPLL